MIIHNLNLLSASVSPNEADAPLVVDANGMLTFPIPFQSFQPISGRGTKVIQNNSIIDHGELANDWP